MAIIIGNSGDNTLSSKKRGDIILGLDGDDTLIALHGFNILLGGDGEDRLTALSSFNILSGGAGNDTLSAEHGWNLLLGGEGDDSLSTSSDENILDGGDGDDLFSILGGIGNTVIGGSGRDTVNYADATQGIAVNLAAGTGTGAGTLSGIENVTGGAGDDTIIGDDGDNVLQGGGGNDTIEAGAGNDIVDGGAGDDLIIGGEGAGDDVYDGGDGSDTVSYASTSQGVAANLASGIATGVEIGTDTLIEIENIVGGTGSDTLIGDANANNIDGGAGDDTIKGGAGNDILAGGEGIDTLSYDDSPTRVIVNMFDLSSITIGGVTVDPGHAFDGFSPAFPLPMPNPPTDTISGFENVIGSAFGDWIQGTTNVANRIEGGDGADMLAGSGASDGIGIPIPGAANDTLLGGAGNDVLRQSRGNDIIDGGEGFDRLEFINNGIGYVEVFGVNVNLGAGTSDADAGGVDSVHGPGGDVAAVSGIEHVRGTAGNDILIGDANANRLEGAEGNDTIDGAAGNDTIRGGAGPDLLIGGAGIDTLLYDDSPNGVIVNMFGMSEITVGGITVAAGHAFDGFNTPPIPFLPTDTVSGFETVIGSAFNDYIQGTSNVANRLEGGAGNDILAGSGITDGMMSPEPGAANDILLGGAGNDVLRQTRGNDFLDGGEGLDRLEFVNNGIPYGATGVFVNLSLGTSDADANDFDPITGLGGPVATVTGIEHVLGTAGNDVLFGDINANRLEGAAGDDVIDGGPGDDTIRGGPGNDNLAGGLGIDTLSYEDSPTRVIVNMLGLTAITVGGITVHPGTAVEDLGPPLLDTTDTVSGFETVIGSAFNDFLQGSTNVANRLEGRDGNDTLVGSGSGDNTPDAANDTLLGDAGDDVLRQTRGQDYLDGGAGFSDRLEFATGLAYGGAIGVNVNLGMGVSDADASGSDLQNGPGGNVATILGFEQVLGTAGNDVLTGGSLARAGGGGFSEFFTGGAGNDTIDGQGADTAQGAYDFDRVDYFNDPAAVIVNLGLTPIVVGSETIAGGTARDGFGGIDTLRHVNYVMGSGFNDILIGGNPEYDHTLERFEGRGGDDFMDGGSGIDEVSYQNATNPVSVDLGAGQGGGGALDTFVNMEGVRGSPFGDTLLGSDKPDVVEHFIGDGGNDFIDGGAGIDFASWQTVALSAGGVTAFIEDGFISEVFHPAIGLDTLVNIEGLIGTSSGDTLTGGAGNQWFRGRGGSDFIDGGADSDTADYSMDPGAVTVNLTAGTAIDGWGGIWGLQGFDTLFNIENVKGSQFNDSITGDANANILDGGGGMDTLTGGANADVFKFGLSSSNNTVTDFDGDVLDFSPLFTAAGVVVPMGEDPLEWLVIQGYLIADSTANVGGGAANDTVVQVDLDGSSGPGAEYTVVTLTDVTLGTSGSDADNWLV